MLRNGNVAGADDWLSVPEPIVGRYRLLDIRRFFRGDAAFARPELYEYPELEGYLYAIRLPSNAVPHREIEPLLTRPVGHPSNKPVVWYHDFVDNQVRLQLFAPAYNLGNFPRRPALPRSVKHWSLTTLREKRIKIGAKVVTHSRYIIFQMAEVAVPRWLFRSILERIRRFRPREPVPG